jgi:predicted nucleotidyltransferase
MNELTELALELQGFCEKRNWRFCLIGGLALQYWGEPRLTKDVDMTLMTGFGGEEEFIREWLSAYESRVPDASNFALANRVLLLRSGKGIGIDIAFGAIPFEDACIKRAVKVELEPGAMLRLCTAEDLIVMKAFANRPQDRVDLRGILVRQGIDNLDWDHIRTYLAPLVEIKEAPEILTHLDSLVEEIKAGS